MAVITEFTTNLIFLEISSNSVTISLLDSGYSSWRMLKRASERSLKVQIPGCNS